MYTISKRFDFSASHQLFGLPEGHQCGRLHGHNYSLVLTLSADELDPIGFVKDYGQLDSVKRFIDITVEHRHLNDVFEFNPTAENMAKYFYDTFKPMHSQLLSVQVKETDKTTATYSPVTGLGDIEPMLKDLQAMMLKLKQEMNSNA